MMAGWKINVSFRHKNMLYQGQSLGWRLSSTRLRMTNDTVTSDLIAFLFSIDPK